MFILFLGFYGVDNTSETTKKVWSILKNFKENELHCLGCHGVVVDEKDKRIFCDIILDFSCDRSEIKSRLEKTIKDKFNEYTVTVIVDSEFS